MKKHVLWLSLLSPMIVCAHMQISTIERVSSDVFPDALRGVISFEEVGKQQDVIKEHLNAIVAEVKHFDPKNEWCRGGGYRLSPRYHYQDGKQIFIGYAGNLSFTCTFPSIVPYNMLSSRIESVKDQNVRTTQGALSWIVSESAQNTARLDLRSSLLQVAKNQAQSFSKELQQHCSVSSVAFEGATPIRPVMMNALRAKTSAMNETVAVEEPLQNSETLTLEATIHYECTEPQ